MLEFPFKIGDTLRFKSDIFTYLIIVLGEPVRLDNKKKVLYSFEGLSLTDTNAWLVGSISDFAYSEDSKERWTKIA